MTTYESPTGFDRPVEISMIDLLQQAIDDGTAWYSCGTTSQLAHELIEAGHCRHGPTDHRDRFGQYVPSCYETESDQFD